MQILVKGSILESNDDAIVLAELVEIEDQLATFIVLEVGCLAHCLSDLAHKNSEEIVIVDRDAPERELGDSWVFWCLFLGHIFDVMRCASLILSRFR